MTGQDDLLGGRRVVVAGTRLHGYCSAIADVFRDFGADVEEVLVWGGREPAFGYVVDHLRYLRRPEARNRAATRMLLRAIRRCRPHLVFVTRPDWIDLAFWSALKNASPATIWTQWLYDPVRRFPVFEAYLPLFDHTFVYSAVESETLPERHPGVLVSYLPAGADDRYHPLEPTPHPRVDLYFNGALANRYYDDRIRTLDALAARARDGHFSMMVEAPLFGPIEALTRRRRYGADHPFVAVLRNRSLGVSPTKLNRRHQEARLSLGHMSLDPDSGLSVRVFEILATGAPQILNRHPDIERMFPDPPFGVFGSPEEAAELATELIRDEKARQRLREHQLDIRPRHLLRTRLRACVQAVLQGKRLRLVDFREAGGA